MHISRVGSLCLILFALAGAAWFALELAPPILGFEDTDDASVSLRFLRQYPQVYALSGLLLTAMATCLTIGTLAIADVLAPRVEPLALRTTTAFGLLAAACFFLHGVLRLSVGPVLHIDGIDHVQGRAAYVTIQMVGVHGVAQAALVTLSAWAVGLSLMGMRTRTLPVTLCALGTIPAFRLLGLLGPLNVLPEILWIVFMLSIPGVMMWCLLLGLALLRRSFANGRAPDPDGVLVGAA